MSKITPCLWFNGEAEEAANFYVSLLPDSKIEIVQRNHRRPGRHGAGGGVHAGRLALHGAEWRHAHGI